MILFITVSLLGKAPSQLQLKKTTGCYVSNEFPCFAVKQDKADPTYLWNYFSRSSVWDEALGLSSGGTPTSRNRLKEDKFLALKVPLPPLPEQRRIVARIEELSAKINEGRTLRQQAAEEMESILRAARGRHVFELRKHYADVPLGEICLKITDGPHVSPRYVEKGVPFDFCPQH